MLLIIYRGYFMKNKRIYLSSPHMGGKELDYVNEAFRTNWISPLGTNIVKFERELCKYIGAKYGVALSSGTAAIHLSLKALGVKPGDVIFCSSFTFAASANPIVYEKAIPVFIDSEKESWNMDPKALEQAFKKYPNVKAVIVVDLYGQSADMDRILEICDFYNVPVIEDAAEILGGTYRGKYNGNFGKLGIFSFNGNKIVTTSGGGMAVSDDQKLIDKIRFWSTQSKEKKLYYEHKELGYNYRMSNVVAGIGRGQMKVINKRVQQKHAIYNYYKKHFKDIDEIEMMPVCDYGKPNYWLSCITLRRWSKVEPIDIIKALEKDNIESRPAWRPLHLQPFYEGCDFFTASKHDISISEDIFNRGLCLPSDTKMTIDDKNRVVNIIKSLF